MTDAHPLDLLWHKHHPPSGYPRGVLAVREPIPGTAFFPGGYGLWRPDISKPLPSLPVGGVMVLGHDFHSETGYRASLERGHEAASQPTWRNLLALLRRASIDPERCFFTNVYMGIREGEGTTGIFPGSKDPRFVDHCVRFLCEQIRAQQPTLILTLGIHVPPLLGRLAPALASWTKGKGLKYLDRVGPVQNDVTFTSAPGVRATVVALTHPSLRSASVRHRCYGGLTGDDAERVMLEEGRPVPQPVASVRGC